MLTVTDLDRLTAAELQSLGPVLDRLKQYCELRVEQLEAENSYGTEAAETARACQEELAEVYAGLPGWAQWKGGSAAPVAPPPPAPAPPAPAAPQAAPPPLPTPLPAPPAPAQPGPAAKAPPMWEPFTDDSKRAIETAKDIACRLGSEDIDTAHLLLAMLKEGQQLPGVDVDTLRNELEVFAGRGGEPVDEAYFTEDMKRVISCAFEEQRSAGDQQVAMKHLLCGLLRVSDFVSARTLVHHGFSLDAARKALKS